MLFGQVLSSDSGSDAEIVSLDHNLVNSTKSNKFNLVTILGCRLITVHGNWVWMHRKTNTTLHYFY